MTYEISDLLTLMIEEGASDLHIQVGIPPTLRVQGQLIEIDGPKLTPENTEDILSTITSVREQEVIRTKGDADFGFSYQNKARFRVSALKSRGHYGLVLRQIPNVIFSLEEIGLPNSVLELLKRPRGLILVTGPTGSGKTTTLASMTDWINTNLSGHIITIEDPIEYVYSHKKCIVTQKEVGTDTPSFAEALRGSLRQDPNFILVGEMRDSETVQTAISAAETGHLVFGTLHTTGSVRTVDRIVDAVPSDSRNEIRTQLAATLVAVISQVLMRKVGGGLIAAYEIMVRTDAIAALIRENKTFRIASELQTGARLGMITLDACLQSLLNRGLIYPEDAINKAYYPIEMRDFVQKNLNPKAFLNSRR